MKKIKDLGQIEFRNVKFAFPDSEGCLFEGVNLVFPKDKNIRIIGATGSGKATSTLKSWRQKSFWVIMQSSLARLRLTALFTGFLVCKVWWIGRSRHLRVSCFR